MAHGIHDDKAIPWTASTSERSKIKLKKVQQTGFLAFKNHFQN